MSFMFHVTVHGEGEIVGFVKFLLATSDFFFILKQINWIIYLFIKIICFHKKIL